MVEVARRPVADRCPCHMRHRMIAFYVDHAFVPGQHAVLGQREGFEDGLRRKPSKAMRHRTPPMVASLRADVVERAAFGDVNLQHRVEPRPAGTGFQQRQRRPRFDPDAVMQDRIGGIGSMDIVQADRPCRLPRHAYQHPVRRRARIQCRKGTRDRRLPRRLQRAIQIACPVDIRVIRLGQPHDLCPTKRQVVRPRRIEHTVHKDQFHPVRSGEYMRLFRVKARRGFRLGRVQCRRIGVAPVFIALARKTHCPQPRQRVRPRRRREPARRPVKARDPRLGRSLPQAILRSGQSHQTASATMSA